MCGAILIPRAASSLLPHTAAVCPWHGATWHFATQCKSHRTAPHRPEKGAPSAGHKAALQVCPRISDFILLRQNCVCAFFKNIIPAPSNTEKKPHINGHASPSHLATNLSNNLAGKQSKSQCLLLFTRFFFSSAFLRGIAAAFKKK